MDATKLLDDEPGEVPAELLQADDEVMNYHQRDESPSCIGTALLLQGGQLSLHVSCTTDSCSVKERCITIS